MADVRLLDGFTATAKQKGGWGGNTLGSLKADEISEVHIRLGLSYSKDSFLMSPDLIKASSSWAKRNLDKILKVRG